MAVAPGDGALDDRLRAVVADYLEVDPDRLVDGARLGEDLQVDSLTAMGLAVEVEEALGVELPDDVVAGVGSYGDLRRFVAERAGTGS